MLIGMASCLARSRHTHLARDTGLQKSGRLQAGIIAAEAGDRRWLANQFDKLVLNVSWRINRQDRSGRNLFEGGFLGSDKIGVIDRSARCLPAATWNRPTALQRCHILPRSVG